METIIDLSTELLPASQPGWYKQMVANETAKLKVKGIPIKLTMGEYEQNWKPKGWNIIFIGPTATWRSEWGNWEAIREIVQNALDESESYDSGLDAIGFYISDKGRGIGVKDFLLGPPKLKEDWARGKYGEGMKIGALALIRNNFPVYVEAGTRELYIIFLEQDVGGKVDTLAALWRDGADHKGTTWHIVNYPGPTYKDRFAVNLPESTILSKVPSTVTKPVQRYNTLIRYDFSNSDMDNNVTGKSRIYARDIFMQEINSPYSYNLWSFDLAPDRHAPKNEAMMWEDIGRVWAGVTSIKLMEDFFKMTCDPPQIKCSESYSLEFPYSSLVPGTEKQYKDLIADNKVLWQEAFNKVFGPDTVIRTNNRYDGLVKHLGYKSQGLSWGVRDTFAKVLKSDARLIEESQDQLREVQILPDNQLTPRQMASLDLTRAIVASLVDSRNIGGVHAGLIPPASDRVRTAGLYSRVTREIFLAQDQLEWGHKAVDVVIHELAHHLSGAEDSEKGHYDKISELAGYVVAQTAGRNYDKWLQNPDFRW